MNIRRLADLLQPFLGESSLQERQLSQLAAYLDLLLLWNARTNLTAVRDADSIVTRHFGESLFLARRLFPVDVEPSHSTVADVGSGAGFPGLPLKVYATEASVTLIESQNKKITFLKEAIRKLGLSKISVYQGRAENWGGQANLVTMRAVERFHDTLPVAASLVRRNDGLDSVPGRTAGHGRLALLIGAGQSREAAGILTGFEWQEPVPIPMSSSRILLVGTPRQV